MDFWIALVRFYLPFLFPFLWVKLFLVSIPLGEIISCFHSLKWSYFLFPFLRVKLFLVSIPLGEVISCFHSFWWNYFLFPLPWVKLLLLSISLCEFFPTLTNARPFLRSTFLLVSWLLLRSKNPKNLWIPESFFCENFDFFLKRSSPSY